MRFSRKTALVTGAAGGIGQAIVAGLRAEGARVAAADLDSSAISAYVHLDDDLLNPKYCDGLITAAVEELGSIDIILNNAGVITKIVCFDLSISHQASNPNFTFEHCMSGKNSH